MKWLSSFIHSVWFYALVLFGKIKGTKQTGKVIEKKLSITKIHLNEGEQYKLGEATVTLAKFGIAGKEEVAKKIAAADARRAARWEKARERAIDLMMMTPEQILELQINEWLDKRKEFEKKLKEFDSLPLEPPPSGKAGDNKRQ